MAHIIHKRTVLLCLMCIAALSVSRAQTVYHYERDNAHLVFFNKELSQYLPHMMRMYEKSIGLHTQLWDANSLNPYHPGKPLMMITDWEDDGNGGVSAIPFNSIFIGMAPLDFSYNISPSTERYHHLFNHEFTHVVMSDKGSRGDMRWRKFLGGKFTVDNEHPISALWSYVSAPRWYAPRWYHEGIACFVETWTGGGVGRALGGYDEMNFRALVAGNKHIYSVVGLETDGTTRDFQVGTNSYLYGTRFVNYLVLKYGLDKLIAFYNRTDDSKMLFNAQFEKVYGQNIRKVWDEWRDYEVEHQKSNLAAISEYPLTPLTPLTGQTLGSVCPPVVDEENHCAYMAVNYPGDFPHIERLDLQSGKRDKLCRVDGSMLYQTSFLTLDKRNQRLIFTTQNGKMRGLRVFDLKKGKITQKLNLQRVKNIVYDNANNKLYGLMSNAGVLHLVRYDEKLTDREILYTFPYGISAFDIDVSHDGQWLTATVSGANGEQSLLRFSIGRLNLADVRCDTLYVSDDSNLGQFRFSRNDQYLIGSSYYTGVSNIWQLNLSNRELELLSNTDLGLFAPVEVGDSLLALSFDADGMRPVTLPRQVLHDANAVSMLGQLAYEAHPAELESIGEHRVPVRSVEFGDVYNQIKEYNSFTSLRFTGAYPEVTGFRDSRAWNNVTPVAGYRFQFSDPVGLHTLKMSLGLSPWSSHDFKNQIHADLEWSFWNWSLNASWNRSDFYDLFGPLQTSRKGWQTSLSYSQNYSILEPFSWGWGGTVAAYGNMDAMPLYQNVSVEEGIHSFQYATAYLNASKTLATLGAVTAEQGWSADLSASTYLADGDLFPSVNVNYNRGWLLPVHRNTSFWLRSSLGANFGSKSSAFGNEYFGGFRNNYVDWRSPLRYRTLNAMPGVEIDAIDAHNYGKLMGELNLPPMRFNNLGSLNFYPTYIFASLFGTGLAANPFETERTRMYYNAGAQVNLELVMFKYLKTMLSCGYARLWQHDVDGSHGQWMVSLKLL